MQMKRRITGALCACIIFITALFGSPALPVRAAGISVTYRTHVQSIGWQKKVKDGELSGTTGKSLRLEAIRISVSNTKYTGNIMYRTHVQNIGWQSWKKNGGTAGTSGLSYRLEAIQIYMTGALSDHYDIYYRVHAQQYGWLAWVKNGEPAGTAGFSYRLEGIQIKIVKKGAKAPGDLKGIKSVNKSGFIKNTGSKTPGNPYTKLHPEEQKPGRLKVVHEKMAPIKLTKKELKIFYAVVYCEAGGESQEAQLGMANVVLNRLRAGTFGKTLKEVVYAPYQFSVVGTAAYNKALKEGVPEKTMKACNKACAGDNNVRDYTSVRPTWFMDPSGLWEYIIIGHIIFFKE